MNYPKINNFTDLIAWKEGHKLVIGIFDVIKDFPRDIYFLKDQMGRCVVSITSCIAEGFSRKSRKEKVQFYFMSLGSTTELQNQLIIAKDLGYLSKSTFDKLNDQTITVHKLINGIIKSADAYSHT